MAAKIDGVDISHYQGGHLDYAAGKKAGVKFIYHKATEGTTYKDPNYPTRREEAKVAGIPVGAYHFARPKVGNAEDEAKFFLARALPKIGDLIPMLDLENNDAKLTRAQLTTWVGTFVNVLAKAGFKTIIYTPFDLDDNFGCPLWVARYNDSMLQPRIPAPWKQYDIWQFSNGVYGKPDSVPGFGNVDINTFREGFTVENLKIPEKQPAPEPVKTAKLTIQHSSMEVFDAVAQQAEDAAKILALGNDIVCGTEGRVAWRALKQNARKYGYFIYMGGRSDSWIAIKKDICAKYPKQKWRTVKPKWGYEKIFSSAGSSGDPHGPYGDRGITFGVFAHKDLGIVSVGTSHYLTKGRTKDQTPPGEFNHYDMNTVITDHIGKWARTYGKKSALAFFTADSNIVDTHDDVFRGEPLTTAWDELGKYPNTGHGTIDVIASYDRDGRVKCIGGRILPELNLHSDHITIKATYEVKLLK